MPKRKLSEPQRHDLIRRALGGDPPPELAREFGVTREYIYNIKREEPVRIEKAMQQAKELMEFIDDKQRATRMRAAIDGNQRSSRRKSSHVPRD